MCIKYPKYNFELHHKSRSIYSFGLPRFPIFQVVSLFLHIEYNTDSCIILAQKLYLSFIKKARLSGHLALLDDAMLAEWTCKHVRSAHYSRILKGTDAVDQFLLVQYSFPNALFLRRLPFAANRRNDGSVLLHGSHRLIYHLTVKPSQFCNLSCIERLSCLLHCFKNLFLFIHLGFLLLIYLQLYPWVHDNECICLLYQSQHHISFRPSSPQFPKCSK